MRAFPVRLRARQVRRRGQEAYCKVYAIRWDAASKADPAADERRWRQVAEPLPVPGQVNLRGLPPLVVAEVLYGLQQRVAAQCTSRLQATVEGVDDWARADATPCAEEITRVRQLISRIKGGLAQLPDAERAQVDQAVAVVRKHRAVSLGMPAARSGPPVTKALA